MNQPGIAFQSPQTITYLQNQKLQELMAYLADYSSFYRDLFSRHGIDSSEIRTIEDLAAIPPTEKEHLQQHNEQFLCVPRNKIIEYTSTSGTLGTPVTIALTENDLQRLAYNEFRSFSCADGSGEDIYQLMLT